jgi:regulator of replication initiation timing
MFNTNGIFNSNYSTSNPFSMNNLNNQQAINEAYAKLEMLKQQTPQKVTVFSDIANELSTLSDDEMNFITTSPEYQTSYNRYQTEFSEFLTNKFANEFITASGGKSLEELLFVIRQKKDAYKSKFAKDINEIRDQNKSLLDKNNRLAEDNEKLKEQLKNIQERLSV